MWKERESGDELVEATTGPEDTTIDVYEVTDGLKDVERDSHRKDHLHHGKRPGLPGPVENLVDVFDKEPAVLENPQESEVDQDAQRDYRLPAPHLSFMGNPEGEIVVS